MLRPFARSLNKKLLIQANFIRFNRAWRPLVLSDSRKFYLVLKLKVRTIRQDFYQIWVYMHCNLVCGIGELEKAHVGLIEAF